MHRLFLTALCFAATFSAGPGWAAETNRPGHVKRSRPVAGQPPMQAGHGINTPSTDFSTLERADDDGSTGSPDRGSMRPVMGADGNLGLGAGF